MRTLFKRLGIGWIPGFALTGACWRMGLTPHNRRCM